MDLVQVLSHPQIAAFETDSRKVLENTLFFALKGEHTDGHLFLEEAAKRKARFAIVSKNYRGPNFGLTLFYVDDPLAALQKLAKIKINKEKKIIAVTGSCGKTTTKEFIAQLLFSHYKIEYSKMNQNSQIGLSLSILNFSKNAPDFYVLEMGMSKKNEISKLVNIAPPNISIITNVGYAHAENFKSKKEIFLAKAEIFTKKTEIALLNYNLLKYKNEVPVKEIFFFSIKNKNADFFLKTENGQACLFEKKKLLFQLPLPFAESHFVENLTCALALCRIINMPVQKIIEAAPSLVIPKMRFQKIEKLGATFINDAYNANPEAMKAALLNLPPSNGKKIAVLGAMKELGKFSNRLHHEIFRFASKYVDEIFCLGDEWKDICPKEKLFFSHNGLAVKLLEIVKPKDLALIKGSRAMQMEKILDLI